MACCKGDKRSSDKWRRRRKVADAKPGNLSFNLQPYIGYFGDSYNFFPPTHDPILREKKWEKKLDLEKEGGVFM